MSLLGALAIAGGISALNGLMSYGSSAASTGLSVDAQKELFIASSRIDASRAA